MNHRSCLNEDLNSSYLRINGTFMQLIMLCAGEAGCFVSVLEVLQENSVSASI